MIVDSILASDAVETDPAASPDWQRSLRELIRSPRELLTLLDLPPTLLDEMLPGHGDFPLRVTRSFAARMRPRDPRDPLLLQVLPVAAERKSGPTGYSTDPLEERSSLVTQGLLHKYGSRVLLITTAACAIHCRYCFRRHFPYAEQRLGQRELQAAVRYVEGQPEVREVIFSGGDPLMLPDSVLAAQLAHFAALPQVTTLRLHTRLPVVLPNRVTNELLNTLAGVGKSIVVIVHANHPREIDAEVGNALRRLRTVATLLNQTVLLRGINDDAPTLAALSEALFEAGALPYYLHQMDLVDGTQHFALSDTEALRLHRDLSARLPGYLVPRLVREVAGEPAKTLLAQHAGPN